MPRFDTFAMLGNSLTGGVWATRPDNTFFAQFHSLLKENGFCRMSGIPKYPGGEGGGWGAVYTHWHKVCREHLPDVILLQGAMEQEGYNQVTTLTAPLPADGHIVTYNATPFAKQLYYLYEAAEPANGEWVLNSRTDGARSIRGLFGTIPRYWPAGTLVLANPNTSVFGTMEWDQAHASRARLDAMLGHILRTSPGYQPIVLVCDVWFDVTPSWTRGIREYVEGLGLPNVGFVEYTKPDGTRIWDDPMAKGPSATITGVAAAGGPPAELTFTCNNEVGVNKLNAGEYVCIHDVSLGAFNAANTEIMRISSVNYGAKTFVVATANRAQWGDTAIDTFGNGDIVCKHSPVGIEMRMGVDKLGSTGFQDCWSRDTHPDDYGYALLAQSAWRAFRKILTRLDSELAVTRQ